MKKIIISKETLASLTGPADPIAHGGTHGGLTHTCGCRPVPGPTVVAALTQYVCHYTTSRNGCATLHTCRWSGITTQPCR
jgi:hypothetical protein